MDDRSKEKYSFQDLIDLLTFLRGPQGCPWDRKQTLADLRKYLLKETYECLSASARSSMDDLCEELGDLLFQIVFQAQVAREMAAFDLDDVISRVCRKMISRHSHLFGEDVARSAQDVELLWEENKGKEKERLPGSTASSRLDLVKEDLSPLQQAYHLQIQAAERGFDWLKAADVLPKLYEEIAEVQELLERPKTAEAGKALEQHALKTELGDVLFAAVNLIRKLDLDAEEALALANAKFRRRFQGMELLCQEKKVDFSALTLVEKDRLWCEVKEKESDEEEKNEIG